MSQWIEQMFRAQIAKNEGIVRRKKVSVDKYASRDELVAAVKKRHFHLVETGDQYIIVCNKGDIKIVT